MSAVPAPTVPESDLTRPNLTWEEFLDLPDDPVYRHAELIDGEIVHRHAALIDGEIVLNPPAPLHQLVMGRIWSDIDDWTRAGEGRGEVTFEPPVQIGPRRGYLPDVAWYRQERCAPPGAPPSFEGAPDLAVEVLSPSTRVFDLHRKRSDYARVGVRELWLVDPEGPAALVLRLPEGVEAPTEFTLIDEIKADGELTSPMLPGLVIRLEDLVKR